ncbi:MAG: hypothetical protein ACHQFW_00345 [Chitinophagales bacterium]
MVRIKLIIVIVAGFLVSSCNNKSANPDEETTDTTTTIFQKDEKSVQEIIDDESTEANYKDAKTPGNKKIISERYSFSFEIPDNWKAVDKSNNGDGYMIETGEKGVDLRVYGENIQGNELMAEMELKACETKDRFVFSNGYPGIICHQSGDVYYYYDTPKTRFTFYVHAPKNWQEKNAAIINAIAKSVAEVVAG